VVREEVNEWEDDDTERTGERRMICGETLSEGKW
jgi:hypothetical protein